LPFWVERHWQEAADVGCCQNTEFTATLTPMGKVSPSAARKSPESNIEEISRRGTARARWPVTSNESSFCEEVLQPDRERGRVGYWVILSLHLISPFWYCLFINSLRM
jgi:hypothetical protein